MNKFWIMLSHTYMSRVKTKSFVITTVLTLLLVIGAANFQSILGLFTGGENEEQIAVMDESGQVYEPLSENLNAADNDLSLVSYDGSEDQVKQEVKDGEYEAFVHIAMNEQGVPEATFYDSQVGTSGASDTIQQSLQQIKIAIATNNAGIEQETVQQIYAPMNFETVSLEEGTKTEEELNSARGLVYVMLFVLYIAVLMYGNMIAMDVANEKTSRVMEILVSSVSPVSQMFAKIFGIALLGLTQVGIIAIAGFAAMKMNQDDLTGGIFEYLGFQSGGASTILYAILFFVLGYLLYATLSAMLGSLVSRVEDVQQLIAPVIYLVMIGFFISMYGIGSPESTIVTVTSYIPFFTPMIMFLRVGMLDIPFWEVGLSIALMLLTIALLAVIGARIYRGGVLMYGTSTSLKDFKKALVLSKKE